MSDDCIIWTGATSNGYGQRSVNGRPTYVHRLAWEQAHNQEIPPGMYVCHRCDVRACYNPSHLFLGSHRDNMRDKAEKGRAPHGEGAYQARLTEATVLAMRAGQISTTEAANLHGVAARTARLAASGKTWRHL